MPKKPARKPALKAKEPPRNARVRGETMVWRSCKDGTPLGKDAAAKIVGAMIPSMALAGLGGVIGAANSYGAISNKLNHIQHRLDRIVAALVADPKQPSDFHIAYRGKPGPRSVSPELAFIRCILLRVPMRVNGTLWRPVKERKP